MLEKNLYFLRHAIALPRGTVGIREEDRPLSSKGEKRMIRAAKGILGLDLGIEAILSSPLLRAYQTAEIVQRELQLPITIEIEETLSPGGALNKFLSKLPTRAERNILLTGHEPAMSSWIEDLLGCGLAATILLKKGALCHLSLDLSQEPPETQLMALLQPSHLRSLE